MASHPPGNPQRVWALIGCPGSLEAERLSSVCWGAWDLSPDHRELNGITKND